MDHMGDAGSRGRWVCPNDRHLALRAKLRTGWSVKTGSLDGRASAYPCSASSDSGGQLALTEEERCAIIEVIRRAEALDLTEQERVGRLVDRLENMKRTVSVVTSSRSNGGNRAASCCALCGEKFAVLGAGPTLCRDCRKYICQKCGIEATSTSATSPGSERSAAAQQRLFLCRICSETREMWKKSGAWFFKGLPKYVLPERKVQQDRGRQRTGSTWAAAGPIRALESADQDSSSDEDAGRRLQSLTRPPSDASHQPDDVKHLPRGVSSRQAIPCSRRASSEDPDPPEASRAPGSFQGSPPTGMSELPRSCSYELNGSRTSIPCRRDSTESSGACTERSQEMAHWELEESGATAMGCGESQSARKTVAWQGTGAAQAADTYGTLEVSLQYDPAAQCLRCRVERARGLRPMDIHGLADPFCKLNILPGTATPAITKRLRTKTVHKTRDPEFNETVNFYGITETSMKCGAALHVLILQDDPAGRDFLGEAKFPLCDLQLCQTKRYNVALGSRQPVPGPNGAKDEEDVWGEAQNPRGQIQLTLSYSTRRRALLVTVQRATNLLPMDSNGFSDPFVKLCLTTDPKDGSQQRASGPGTRKENGKKQAGKSSATHATGVKWKTLNPEWNEEFAFETRLTDLTSLRLSLSVWDKDFGKSNDYLGGLTLSCSSKGERLRHWIDAIKFPDHRHQAWHNLIEEIVPTE